jgi:hypothetical protein
MPHRVQYCPAQKVSPKIFFRKTARQKSDTFFFDLLKEDRFKAVKFENGSHIIRLNIKNKNLQKFKESLGKKNIQLPNPDENGFLLKINPSFNRDTPENLASSFLESLKEPE